MPSVERMMLLNDDAFARMVAEEVKNKLSPLHKKQLMQKENWERWRDALLFLSENLQEQIDEIEYDSNADEARYMALGRDGKRLAQESKSAYDSKLKKISRFKFHVDKRLDEVAAMIDTGDEITLDGWEQVDFYKRAIAVHRSMLRDFDLLETSIDRALWATLEGGWDFDEIDVDSL
jgi:hypothetical protein